MKFHGLFLFSASVTKPRLTFGQKSQEKKRQAIRLTSKDAKTRPTTKISYCFRLGFCVSNFLSIISDFLSLIPNKLSQKLSNKAYTKIAICHLAKLAKKWCFGQSYHSRIEVLQIAQLFGSSPFCVSFPLIKNLRGLREDLKHKMSYCFRRYKMPSPQRLWRKVLLRQPFLQQPSNKMVSIWCPVRRYIVYAKYVL